MNRWTEPISLEDHPLVRLRRAGMEALSDAEVLTLALGHGQGSLPARELARHLLSTYEGLSGVARTGLGPLACDLGERRAARLMAGFELARRVRAVPLRRTSPFRTSHDVVRAFGPRLLDATEERVLAVVLDGRQRPIAERVLAQGAVNACALGMREVFSLVVREGGASLVLVHNHPSGDPMPSREDITFTRGVLDAGALLDLSLLDHVIIARDGVFSFLDAGLLQRETGT